MTASNLSITFINNSTRGGTACVFQQDPNGGYNTFPLAWLTQFANPNNSTRFEWGTEYSFVWASTGRLMPGVLFTISGQTPADPGNANQTTLSGGYGDYQFSQPQTGGRPGGLTISTAASVQQSQVSVGIGMSGAATFACQAQPNNMCMFNTGTQYCLAFGNYQQGQVLDPGQPGDFVEVNFPPNVSAMTVTLNPDGRFNVSPS